MTNIPDRLRNNPSSHCSIGYRSSSHSSLDAGAILVVTMPIHNKARSSSSRLAHIHRTTSGGSSKVSLNTAALTQKDPPQPKQQQQNLKSAVHSSTDVRYYSHIWDYMLYLSFWVLYSVASESAESPACSSHFQFACSLQRSNCPSTKAQSSTSV